MTDVDFGAFGLVLLVASLAAGALMRQPARRSPRRSTPPRLLLPGDPEAAWTQAPVPGPRLRLDYREVSGSLTHCVVQPRSIRGEPVGENRVRLRVLNAYSETEQSVRAFRFERIERAADTLSGEFIDDLYTYLCSAQPGGAPARLYAPARSPEPEQGSAAIPRR